MKIKIAAAPVFLAFFALTSIAMAFTSLAADDFSDNELAQRAGDGVGTGDVSLFPSPSRGGVRGGGIDKKRGGGIDETAKLQLFTAVRCAHSKLANSIFSISFLCTTPPLTPPRLRGQSRYGAAEARQGEGNSEGIASSGARMLVRIADTKAIDPPVPPGRDPGGIKVAIIGRGIDYTLPHLANMLARDGEGEIIGYDFADDDRRPFPKPIDDPLPGPYATNDTVLAEIITGEGQAATLAPIRVEDDIANLGKGIGYAAQTPATIISIMRPYSNGEFIALMKAASARFKDRLFIIPAGDTGKDLDDIAKGDGQNLENVLVVNAADAEGALTRGTNVGALTVDVAMNVDGMFDEITIKDQKTPNPPSGIAVARLTAMAARLKAVEPGLTPPEMKKRILAVAEPLVAGPRKGATRSGFIRAPRRHWWLE